MTTKKHATNVAAPKGTHWHRYGNSWYLILHRSCPVIYGHVTYRKGVWQSHETRWLAAWGTETIKITTFATRQEAQQDVINGIFNP